MRAFAAALQEREPLNPAEESRGRIAFERFAVESFVWGSANIEVFFPALEQAADTLDLVGKFGACFSTISSPMFSFESLDQYSPLLGCHPRVFNTLVEALKAVRCGAVYPATTHMMDSGLLEPEACHSLQGLVYIYTAQIALLCWQDLQHPDFRVLKELEQLVKIACVHIQRDPLQKPFGKYFLIPLAVVGALVTDCAKQAMLRRKLDTLLDRIDCRLIQLVQKCLNDLWASKTLNESASRRSMLLSALLMLIDTTSPSWWLQDG